MQFHWSSQMEWPGIGQSAMIFLLPCALANDVMPVCVDANMTTSEVVRHLLINFPLRVLNIWHKVSAPYGLWSRRDVCTYLRSLLDTWLFKSSHIVYNALSLGSQAKTITRLWCSLVFLNSPLTQSDNLNVPLDWTRLPPKTTGKQPMEMWKKKKKKKRVKYPRQCSYILLEKQEAMMGMRWLQVFSLAHSTYKVWRSHQSCTCMAKRGRVVCKNCVFGHLDRHGDVTSVSTFNVICWHGDVISVSTFSVICWHSDVTFVSTFNVICWHGDITSVSTFNVICWHGDVTSASTFSVNPVNNISTCNVRFCKPV